MTGICSGCANFCRKVADEITQKLKRKRPSAPRPSGNSDSARFRRFAVFSLGVVWLIAGAVLLLPPDTTDDRVFVDQESSPRSASIQPLRTQETHVIVSVRADSSKLQSNEVLDFGNLRLQVLADNTVLQVANGMGDFETIRLIPSCGQCTITLGPGSNYSARWQNLADSHEEWQLPRRVQFGNLITKLPLIESGSLVSVEVNFGMKKLTQPLWRSLAAWLFALITVVTVFIYLRPTLRKLVFVKTDVFLNAFVGLALVSSAILLPSQADEGWVQARSDSALLRGFFGNIFSAGDLIHPQGTLLESLFAMVLWLGGGHVHLRLVIAVIGYVTWIIIAASLKDLFLDFGIRGFLGILVAAGSYITFSIFWLTNVRSEPFVALLFALLIFAMFRLVRSRDLENLMLVGVAGATALSTHQSAVVVLPLLLVTLLVVLISRTWKFRNRALPKIAVQYHVAFAVFFSGAILFFSAGSLYGMHILLEDLSGWQLESTHSQSGNFSAELSRMTRVLEVKPGGLLLVAGIIALSVFFLQRVKFLKSKSLYAWVTLSIIVSPLALVLTGSKWVWHYAVLVVPATLGIGLFSGYLDERVRTAGKLQWATRLIGAAGFTILPIPFILSFFGVTWLYRVPDLEPFSSFRNFRHLLDFFSVRYDFLGFVADHLPSLTVLIGFISLLYGVSAFARGEFLRPAAFFLASLAPGLLLLSGYGVASWQATAAGQWNEAAARIAQLGNDQKYNCVRQEGQQMVSEIVSPLSGKVVSLKEVRETSRLVDRELEISAVPEGFLDGTTHIGIWVFDPYDHLKVIGNMNSGKLESSAAWVSGKEGWLLYAASVDEFSDLVSRVETDGPLRISGPFGLHTESVETGIENQKVFAGPKHFQFPYCEQSIRIDGAYVGGLQFRTEKTFPPETSGIDWFEVTIDSKWFNLIFEASE